MFRARHLSFLLLLAACGDSSGGTDSNEFNSPVGGGTNAAPGGNGGLGTTGGGTVGSPGAGGGVTPGQGGGVTPGQGGGVTPIFPGNTGDVTGGIPGGQPGVGGGADPSGLPCAVKKIAYEKCGACHSDPPVGTFMPLLTHAHFQAVSSTPGSEGQTYAALAQQRINDAQRPMPPAGSPPLTPDELATLNAWLGQGAPQGTESCDGGAPVVTPTNPGGAGDQAIDTTGLECVKFLAHANRDKSRKYRVGAVRDGYVNVNVRAPWRQTVYGVVVKPVIDNAQVLHHWLLYKQPGQDGVVQASGGEHPGGELIHGWAPGGEALNFRQYDDVGIELPASNYVVEFHYNSNDPNAEDASGVEICYRTDRPTNIAGLSWVGKDHGQGSYIAGAISETLSGDCLNPQPEWTGECRPRGHNQPIHIVGVSPHMHESGVHMKAVIKGPGGQFLRTLHDAPFAFDSQVHYDIDEVLMPGEYIETTCNFSKPQCAGQATGAEMCYLFTYSYPKGALADGKSWGAIAHGANTCLGQEFLDGT